MIAPGQLTAKVVATRCGRCSIHERAVCGPLFLATGSLAFASTKCRSMFLPFRARIARDVFFFSLPLSFVFSPPQKGQHWPGGWLTLPYAHRLMARILPQLTSKTIAGLEFSGAPRSRLERGICGRPFLVARRSSLLFRAPHSEFTPALLPERLLQWVRGARQPPTTKHLRGASHESGPFIAQGSLPSHLNSPSHLRTRFQRRQFLMKGLSCISSCSRCFVRDVVR